MKTQLKISFSACQNITYLLTNHFAIFIAAIDEPVSIIAAISQLYNSSNHRITFITFVYELLRNLIIKG